MGVLYSRRWLLSGSRDRSVPPSRSQPEMRPVLPWPWLPAAALPGGTRNFAFKRFFLSFLERVVPLSPDGCCGSGSGEAAAASLGLPAGQVALEEAGDARPVRAAFSSPRRAWGRQTDRSFSAHLTTCSSLKNTFPASIRSAVRESPVPLIPAGRPV